MDLLGRGNRRDLLSILGTGGYGNFKNPFEEWVKGEVTKEIVGKQ